MRFLTALIVFVCLTFQSAYAQEYFYYQPNGNFTSPYPPNNIADIHLKVCTLVGAAPAILAAFSAAVSAAGTSASNKYEWSLYGWINDESTSTYKLVRPMTQAVQTFPNTNIVKVGFICLGTKPILGYQGVLKRNAGYWTPSGVVLKEAYAISAPGGYANLNDLQADCANALTGSSVAVVNQIYETFYQNSSICVNALFKDNVDNAPRKGYYYGIPGQAGCTFGFNYGAYTPGSPALAAGICFGPKPVTSSYYTSATRVVSVYNFNIIGKYSRFESIANYPIQSLKPWYAQIFWLNKPSRKYFSITGTVPKSINIFID
ncbi:hypothetical protein DFA_05165 [Cavenderia fasciculata]|uniref:Uncharacterized protein n=1 Tax=Cavenderia fasciculata TaxID=261658 RepID=F4PNI2_CACFS|nr:uncharacterized protein DFA_05165 [Cavenderia fasciculata]EGG23035.1 hypothetical protein DFA_05165 [Cavenderia fasciculata]|eukprot:XP_004360886.1 hypothetical protein DFA_05165 [Cavenderia fasciculata]